MRLGLMTTWGEPCGIATYSEQLAARLLLLGIDLQILAAAALQERSDPPEMPATVCWERTHPAIVADAVERMELDVLHIQHEHGLFLDLLDGQRRLCPSDGAFFDTIESIRAAGCKRVMVTLHTVTPYSRDGRSGFYDRLRDLADGIIVHTVACRAAVSCAQGRGVVWHVPHGTEIAEPGDRIRGRELIGVHDGRLVVLVPGFVARSKNIEGTIRSWALAVPDIAKPAVLVVRGLPQRQDNYPFELEELAAYLGRPVSLQWEFTSAEDLRHVLAAADIGILNTDSYNLGASGQVHLCAAAGLPLIVPDRPIYHEALMGGAVPFLSERLRPYDANLSMANAVVSMANEPSMRQRVGQDLQSWALSTAWERVAKTHEQFYEAIR